MQRLLHANLPAYLHKSKYALALLVPSPVPCPHLYIKSASCIVTWAYINHMVCVMIGKPVTNLFASLQTSETDYLYNNYMFVINANSESIPIIKSIVEQKCLVLDRHIIVINIIEQLRDTVALALYSVINSYSNTTLFIVVNGSAQPITRSLQNLLLSVHLDFDMELFKKDFESQSILDLCIGDSDPLNLCIQMETKLTLKDFLGDYVRVKLDLLKSATTTQTVYYNELRNLVISIGAGCVPVPRLCEILLQWHADGESVAILAEMEAALRITTKELFGLEHYINRFIQHRKSKI